MSNRRKVTRRAVSATAAAALTAEIRQTIIDSVPAAVTLRPEDLDRVAAHWRTRDGRPSSAVLVMAEWELGDGNLILQSPGSLLASLEDLRIIESVKTWREFFARSFWGEEMHQYVVTRLEDECDEDYEFDFDAPFKREELEEWLWETERSLYPAPDEELCELPPDIMEAFADIQPSRFGGNFYRIDRADADALSAALAERGILVVADRDLIDATIEFGDLDEDLLARWSWYGSLSTQLDRLPRVRGAQPPAPTPLKASAALQQRAIKLAAPDLKPEVLELQAQGVLDDPGVTAALLTGRRALEKLMQPSPLEKAAQATMKAHGLSREEYDEKAKLFGG